MSDEPEPILTADDQWYSTVCGAALFGLIVTYALHYRATLALRDGTTFSAKRLLYQFIVRLAPAIASLNFLAVTSPPMHRTISMLQHVVVAGCMACFMELLLLLLYRTSSAPHGRAEALMPPITNIVQKFEMSLEDYNQSDGDYLNTVLTLLRQQPAIAIWTSPPIGCCFLLCPCCPCGKPQAPTICLLWMLRRTVLVYVLGAIVAPFFEMWLEGVPALDHYHEAAQYCTWIVETLAMLLALYSLFIMYRLAHDPLSHYQTTLKFLAIKLVMWVFTLQRIALVSHFGHVGLWWAHAAICVECPALSILLMFAFPASELKVTVDDKASIGRRMSVAADAEDVGLDDVELDRLL